MGGNYPVGLPIEPPAVKDATLTITLTLTLNPNFTNTKHLQ